MHAATKVNITDLSFEFMLHSIQFDDSILQIAAENGHFDAAELLLSAKVC